MSKGLFVNCKGHKKWQHNAKRNCKHYENKCVGKTGSEKSVVSGFCIKQNLFKVCKAHKGRHFRTEDVPFGKSCEDTHACRYQKENTEQDNLRCDKKVRRYIGFLSVLLLHSLTPFQIEGQNQSSALFLYELLIFDVVTDLLVIGRECFIYIHLAEYHFSYEGIDCAY